MEKKKILTVYYSRSGQNYVGGTIKNLPVGNTEVAAQLIRDVTGCDLHKIETVKAYPADYTETTEVAKVELRQKARPDLAGTPVNIGNYEVIILGYPNWWGTAPMAVFTFLESHDLSGKVLLPFCTHEGSGLGHSENDLRKAAPGARVLPGLAILGSTVAQAQKPLEAWLKNSIPKEEK